LPERVLPQMKVKPRKSKVSGLPSPRRRRRSAARLRNGGSQTVRIEHVHVNEGGQAVIGNLNPNSGSTVG